MRLILATMAAAILSAPVGAQVGSGPAINRILDEGMNHGEVMEIAAYLSDRIGGRLTNSPQMREAERWTQQRFRDWGLTNVHVEPFEFGRGWSINRASARMIEPRPIELNIIPVAWTPATAGPVRAGIVVAPMERERDFDKWRGKLSGKIVLVSYPGTGSEPSTATFQRLGGDDLAKLGAYQQPTYSPAAVEKMLKDADFFEKRDAFLKSEGALAWVRISPRDAGLLEGTGYTFQKGRTPALPGIEMAAEDYRRLARLARTDAPPTLEVNSDVRFHDEDANAYNVIADIAGTDPAAGYVMAGAHFDSWVASDGATDNAAGTSIVMEAARILSKLRVRPKRTIRFALWNGEEQGLLGSLAYVERHLATRAPVADPVQAQLNPYFTWLNRWPVTPKPGHQDLAAYFNMDNGGGKIRGIYAEGNLAAVPIFQEWLAPFSALGASTVSPQATGSTDHVYLQAVGVPGYQFIQDPLDYDTRTHHTSIDSYDHLKGEDMRQAAVILATFLLNAANSADPLPRPPLPTKPRPTDPFEYPKED